MARIRTIKPEYWSSEKVMACSHVARLLFIGIWNFCDDGGNHPMAARTIKALVFPGDDITTEQVATLLAELEAAQLLQSYWAGGKNYLHVRGWRHQKIEKKNFKYPTAPQLIDDQSPDDLPPFDDQSPTGSQPVDPGREGKGIGEDQHNSLPAKDPAAPVEMALDWVPDAGLLKAYAFRVGIAVDEFTPEAIGPFVCHYAAKGRVETQTAWVSLLVRWFKQDQVVAAAGSKITPLHKGRTSQDAPPDGPPPPRRVRL